MSSRWVTQSWLGLKGWSTISPHVGDLNNHNFSSRSPSWWPSWWTLWWTSSHNPKRGGPWWTSWYFEDFLVTCGSVVNFVVTPIRIKPLVMWILLFFNLHVEIFLDLFSLWYLGEPSVKPLIKLVVICHTLSWWALLSFYVLSWWHTMCTANVPKIHILMFCWPTHSLFCICRCVDTVNLP